MTKSPLALAHVALSTAAEALPAYSSKYSRKDFTRHQLFALLVSREFLRIDYRGLEALPRDWSDLRDELGLTRVPDHSTLQKAGQRLLQKKGPSDSSAPPAGVPGNPPRQPLPRLAAGPAA